MFLSVAQFSANANHKHGSVFFADGVFTLLRSLVGIHLEEFLTVYERDFLWQERLELWIGLACEIFGTQYCRVDSFHHIFQ